MKWNAHDGMHKCIFHSILLKGKTLIPPKVNGLGFGRECNIV